MSLDKIQATFDTWAATGRDASMERGHQDVVEQVLEQLEIKAGEQILDLGCGNGWATRLLAKSAAGTGAVGVDASPAMIKRAEELHSFTIRARYEAAAFEALPFKDAQFDRAFSMEALYYATDLKSALSELARVLKPGAAVDVVIDYYAGRPGVETWPAGVGLELQTLTPDEWRTAFEGAGLGDVSTETVNDRRGAGDEGDFESSDFWPDFATKQAYHEAGSLWIRARKA